MTFLEGTRRKVDMTWRCAFALCSRGSMKIRFLNESYHVEDNCIIACMPFVSLDIEEVESDTTIIFGFLNVPAVPDMISRWVDTDNLFAIRNQPIAKVTPLGASRLTSMLSEYQMRCAEWQAEDPTTASGRICADEVMLSARLILAHVLKMYYSAIPMYAPRQTPSDSIFQRFILSLYSGFREHRDVCYYAMHSGVSLKYFSTIVRRISGSSPSEWIETVVTGEAKTLLDDRRKSIKDIAAELHFPDAPTFTKYFRRITGLTPRAYRNTTQG